MLLRNIFLILLFAITFLPELFSQSNSEIKYSKNFDDAKSVNNTFTQQKHISKLEKNLTGCLGETWTFTGYDYAYNNSALTQLALADIDGDGSLEPVTVGIVSMVEGGVRHLTLCKCDGSAFHCITLFDTTLSIGIGSLKYCSSGPLEGNVIVVANSSSQSFIEILDIDSLNVIYQGVLPFSGGVSFDYVPDGTIWAVSNFRIYKSTDSGVNWQEIVKIGDGDADFDSLALINGPAELPIHSSPDGQYLSVVGGFEGAYLTGNPDVVYWYYSTDYGTTWQGEAIGRGSGSNTEWGQIANRNYAPYFTNFSQMNAIIDSAGYTHVACNGYGIGVLPGETDTTNVFPILYWNSRDKQWLAVSSPDYEAPTDGFGNSILDLYPGNGIGEAYPAISIEDNGASVIVSWQAVEFTGIPGNSPYNIYPGDGGANSAPKYYTDLLMSISWNGGSSFENSPAILKGDPDVEEMYPFSSTFLEWIGEFLVMHYIYYIDPVPGVHLFSQENGFDPNGQWVYDLENILWVSVNDEQHKTSFSLKQNYPNPFNPNTTIKYSIPNAGNVTLKVYDVLGKEVATLVKEAKPGGEYEVEFDGSKLPSGIYFYQLKAGNFIQIRKMVLLK